MKVDRPRAAIVLAVGVSLCALTLAYPTAGAAQANRILDGRTPIPYAAQRPGDPEAGYRALTSREWVGCGAPAAYYDVLMAIVPERWRPKFETLPDRAPGQEGLPYFLNLFLSGDWTANGFDVGCVEAAIMSGRLAARAVLGLSEATMPVYAERKLLRHHMARAIEFRRPPRDDADRPEEAPGEAESVTTSG